MTSRWHFHFAGMVVNVLGSPSLILTMLRYPRCCFCLSPDSLDHASLLLQPFGWIFLNTCHAPSFYSLSSNLLFSCLIVPWYKSPIPLLSSDCPPLKAQAQFIPLSSSSLLNINPGISNTVLLCFLGQHFLPSSTLTPLLRLHPL